MVKSLSRARRGFTLVELLVVIAIIGILVALLLPAVQAARESSRRSSCGNNLKQLGTAIHNYHDTYKNFPINYSGNNQYNATATGRSWMIGILPFMEQKTLHDQVRFDLQLGQADASGALPNTDVSKTVIATFLCPSDGANGNGSLGSRANLNDVRAITCYKACAGGNWNAGDHGGVTQASGPWPNNADGLDHGNGIICRNAINDPSNCKNFASVIDGLSNTFAVGETVPAWCQHTWWYWFNGATATCGVPLNYRVELGDAYLVSQYGDWGRNYSFFSRHPGGGQFTMCDASTRFFASSIDITLYRSLATVAGGEAVNVRN
jgi:prepilin-type N-terminal cleavage/methylation domain-containing protein